LLFEVVNEGRICDAYFITTVRLLSCHFDIFPFK
jgi:hypothetical protein